MEPGQTFTSPRGTVIEIVDDRPERFAMRRTLPPGTGRTAPHRHLDGVEGFRLLSGSATGWVGRTRRRLTAGDVMEVPVRAVHVHPHTGRGETAVLEHWIEPRTAFVEAYFPAWTGWLESGRVDRQDELTVLGVMAVVDTGAGGTWLAGVPIAAQRALGRRLAPLAARRGYRLPG